MIETQHPSRPDRLAGLNLSIFPGASRLWLIAWFAAMAAVPIAIWLAGLRSTPATMLIATTAQAILVATLLQRAWGWRRTLAAVFVVALLGWGVERLGTQTGIPFGHYDYTNLLWPQIGGVPLLIPLAWFMMLPVSWAVGELICGRNRGWRFLLTAAAAMTAWDLFLDPQMVAWGFWRWHDVPAASYFGIPWQNYLGWLLAAAAITLLSRPPSLRLVARPLLVVYTLTWLLETGGLGLFWGLPGPAAAGALGMGLFVKLGWWKTLLPRKVPPARPTADDV